MNDRPGDPLYAKTPDSFEERVPASVEPRRSARRWLRRILWAFCAVVLAALMACAYLRIRSPRDVHAHLWMWRHNSSAWTSLALRRIGPGDSVEKLVELSPPLEREDFGKYTLLRYVHGGGFGHFAALAEDGVLIGASSGSCTWRHYFFGETLDLTDYYKAYDEHLRDRISGERPPLSESTASDGSDGSGGESPPASVSETRRGGSVALKK